MFKMFGIVVYLSFGSDLATTEYGLHRGGIEMNPMMKKREIRIVSSVVCPLVINLMTEKLYKENPKAATGIRICVSGLKFAVAYHNYRQFK